MSSLNLASTQMTVERNLSTVAGSGKLKRYLTVVWEVMQDIEEKN